MLRGTRRILPRQKNPRTQATGQIREELDHRAQDSNILLDANEGAMLVVNLIKAITLEISLEEGKAKTNCSSEEYFM